MTNKNKYCDLCSCKLGIDTPSPAALERLHAMQVYGVSKNTKKKPVDTTVGCDFFINSADHNYCFWTFAKTITGPMTDREICQLLVISPAELKAEYALALETLQGLKDHPEMANFVELIIDQINSDRRQEYVESSLDVERIIMKIDKIIEEENAEITFVKKRRGRATNSGQPRHRDGKKVDLWGLSKKGNKNAKD